MMRRRSTRRGGTGVVGTVARTAVIAGTATAVSGKVSQSMHAKAQQEAAVQQAAAQRESDLETMKQQLDTLHAQQIQEVAPAAAPAPAPAGGGDLLAQLQQLGDMKTAGLLNDQEFEAAKARILGT